jgi:hypothetical protein
MNRSNTAQRQSEGAVQPIAAFRVRGFGLRQADLDLDFSTDDHPRLVTDILAACLSGQDGAALEAESIWSMAVSRRIEWLLRIASTRQMIVWRATVRCPRAECRELGEIDLPLVKISALQRRAEERELAEWRDGTTVLDLRRPTGRDQRGWRSEAFADEHQARRAMVATLTTRSDGVAEAPLEVVDDLLAELDPLVPFNVHFVCPRCGGEADCPIDLQAMALGELEKIQRQLVESIHRLALHYHWSESEIIELTAERRARYLRLIEAEAGL